MFCETGHTYDRHPLADVVEVQYGQQGVRGGTSHLRRGYSPGSPGAEHEAKVPSRRHQSALVRRLSLVKQLPWWDNKDGSSAGAQVSLPPPPSGPLAYSPSLFSSLMTV